jgi:hypothetical protein
VQRPFAHHWRRHRPEADQTCRANEPSCVTSDSKGLQSQKTKLIQQLHNYSAVYNEPKMLTGLTRRGWTGKCMGEQDDLCIALQLAIFFRGKYLSMEAFTGAQ